MQNKPVLLITLGDPAGVGPEIILKALAHREVYAACRPVVVGDAAVLEEAKARLGSALALEGIAAPQNAVGAYGTLEYIDLGLMAPGGWPVGRVDAACGDAAFRYVEKAIALAMAGQAAGVVTAPLNKEAMNLAGHHYAGHTEIFAQLTGTRQYAMLLAAGPLRVMHATTHLALRDACAALTKDRILAVLRLAALAQRQLGQSGAIAVAGLNPHASENGLFGTEEQEAIIPAVEAARALGIPAEGPVPPDTVFVKALAGQYGMVVAMYHDQGHIPVKLVGFTAQGAVGGVNCTVGLPIIRTSVDHGTAFDLAGKGLADETSLLDAIAMAAQMAESDAPRTLEAQADG